MQTESEASIVAFFQKKVTHVISTLTAGLLFRHQQYAQVTRTSMRHSSWSFVPHQASPLEVRSLAEKQKKRELFLNSLILDFLKQKNSFRK
jgi:hypothetical protein